MACMDTFKKIKRFRLFEPSVQILGFVFGTVLVTCCFLYFNYGDFAKGFRFSTQPERFMGLKFNGSGGGERKVEFLSEKGGACDVFEGDWVWDESYPLYQSKDCNFLDGGFRCSENGRPDLFYTKWRWQPKACNLPRFFILLHFPLLYLQIIFDWILILTSNNMVFHLIYKTIAVSSLVWVVIYCLIFESSNLKYLVDCFLCFVCCENKNTFSSFSFGKWRAHLFFIFSQVWSSFT